MADGDNYVSTTDVYRTSGISSTEVSQADVLNQILEAEGFVCRYTKNIYYKTNLAATSLTSATTTTLTAAMTVTLNGYSNQYVEILSGAGKGQFRKVLTNTTTGTLVLDRDLTVVPSASDTFRVFYVPSDFSPYVEEIRDGKGYTYFYTDYYPIQALETVTLSGVDVSASNVYVYKSTGKLVLKSGAEANRFGGVNPQDVELTYWYGVDKLEYAVKRVVELRAAIQILGQQMGGTFDDPSTVTLPDMTVSVGQAYINIRSSLETLKEEYNELLKTIKVWPVVAD
jgi:hypothetical protein